MYSILYGELCDTRGVGSAQKFLHNVLLATVGTSVGKSDISSRACYLMKHICSVRSCSQDGSSNTFWGAALRAQLRYQPEGIMVCNICLSLREKKL